LHTTLARPDASDSGFNRESAWSTLAIWPGAGSAAKICEAGLSLEHARLTEDGGNIALGGLTRATKTAPWPANDARLLELGIARWEKVSAMLSAATGLSGEPLRALLLRPTTTAAPVLDEAQQRLNWAVQDENQDWLTLTIPCGPESAPRIQNLDRITARKIPILAVLAVLDRSGARVFLNPAALVIGINEQALRVVSLDYANEPAVATSIGDRILRMLKLRQDTAPPIHGFSLVQRLLSPVSEVLETQAATGRVQLTEHQADTLKHAFSVLQSVGMHTLATAVHAHLLAPSMLNLMRLNYLCEVLIELEGFDV
jgi:hypothetical protein